MNRRDALKFLAALPMPALARTCTPGPELPPYPVPVAGQFVGIHRDRLIVAGGTIWTKPKWEGGEKRWTTAIHTFGPGDTQWQLSGEQPEPVAYGAAVSTPAGLVCIGGQSPNSSSAAVHLLHWDGARLRQSQLPDLPEPAMLLGGAALNRTLFAIAGQNSPTATAAISKVWKLDPGIRTWHPAAPIPGPPRILPVVAASKTEIYVASGASLAPDADSKPRRTYLRDAFRYHPASGWSALPPLPAPVLAAPSYCDRAGRFVILGGDAGTHAGEIPDPGPNHPGFSRTILQWKANHWNPAGTLPEGLVTTGAAIWRGNVVVPAGENRPGTRTTRVLTLDSSLACGH
jgi:N-acetylneuraminic acid mutarotase